MFKTYTVHVGKADCESCNSRVYKYFRGVANPSTYCKDCIGLRFGITISKEDREVPVWVLKVADKYTRTMLHYTQKKGVPLGTLNFVANFWKVDFGTKVSLTKRGAILGDKEVDFLSLVGVNSYLYQRQEETRNQEEQVRRRDLVCPCCKGYMAYTGKTGTSVKGDYLIYHCLSAKHLQEGLEERLLYGYFPQVKTLTTIASRGIKSKAKFTKTVPPVTYKERRG